MSGNRNPSYQWISPGQSVKIHNFVIPDGNIYVGQDLYSLRGNSVDAALINPQLPVRASKFPQELGYWSSYSEIDPSSRYVYLQWLSSGKNNPYIDLGYVFIYFYGLERRLLVDRPSAEEAWLLMGEVQRLVNIYQNQSYSIRRYLKKLVATTWAYYHRFNFIPDYIDLLDGDNFNVVETLLATCQQYQRPVPSKVALAWAANLSYSRSKHHLQDKDFREAITKLFMERYQREFGNGALISPPEYARALYLDYTPASDSLYGYNSMLIEGAKTPSQEDHFSQQCLHIFSSAVTDVRQHLTVMRSPAPTLNSISKLPPSLLKQLPATERLMMLLKANPDAQYPLREIHSAFVPKQPTRIPTRDINLLNIILQSLGLSLFPNPEHHPYLKLNADSMVMLVENHGFSKDQVVDKQHQLLTSLVKASFLTGALPEQRLTDFLNKQLESLDLAEAQRSDLENLIIWCKKNLYTIVPKELAELDEDQQRLLIQNLVYIATQSAHLEKSTLTELAKFGHKLKKLTDFDITALVQKQLAAPNRGLVTDPAEKEVNPLHLDYDRIHETLTNTQAAQSMLHDVLSDEDKKSIELKLDNKHQLLLHYLLSHGEHNYNEVEEKAKTLGLFTDGALEAINEWSVVETGAILVEVDDLIYIEEEAKEALIKLYPQLEGQTDE